MRVELTILFNTLKYYYVNLLSIELNIPIVRPLYYDVIRRLPQTNIIWYDENCIMNLSSITIVRFWCFLQRVRVPKLSIRDAVLGVSYYNKLYSILKTIRLG